MADYSKQWCDQFDPGGMEPDFDIFEILETIDNGMGRACICEGYGFLAVGKDEEGNGLVFMPDEKDFNFGIWVPLDEVIGK